MKYLIRKIIGSVAIIADLSFVVYLFSLGVNIPEYVTGLAVAFSISTLGIGFWMFRPEISKAIGKKKTKSHPILKFVKFSPSHRLKEDGRLYKRFRGELKSFGNISINEIHFYYSYQNKEPTLDEILSDSKFRKQGPDANYGVLLPESLISLTTSEFQYDESASNPLWFTVWLDYEFAENGKESYIFVLRINGESVANEDVRIYDPSDIAKKKEELKKGKDGI